MSKKKIDGIERITQFQKTVLAKKPPLKKMKEDVRMMRFKIRPLKGDVSLLDIANNEFIEALWSLGKMDEFFYRELKNLSEKEQGIVLPLFNGMYQKFQEDLDTLNLKYEKLSDLPNGFEVEIYKERFIKMN
ncbi:hypothetical protein HGA88_06055 [Candidatus Roizmanbacteria bacterium]|nr:hypothetical protein [Candidatus Roizmanbacteria bacterium]